MSIYGLTTSPMKTSATQLGELLVTSKEEIFEYLAEAIKEMANQTPKTISVGLSGGSTPVAWYQWATRNRAFSQKAMRNIIWSTSDERHVHLASPESNFGNALRYLLDPLDFSEDKYFPWPVEFEPEAASIAFESQWTTRFGPDKAFDICMLGMGDDCHTVSIFPGSDLFERKKRTLFAAVNVPDKGWRYSLTPLGLTCCERILLVVLGEGKQEALRRVLKNKVSPEQRPVQLLAQVKDKVTILADDAATALL